MNTVPEIFVKAPGRICLFGDHQDYLGLPVIACAIDRYIFLEAQRRNDHQLEIRLPDVNQTRSIDLKAPLNPIGERDYFVSALKVVIKHGIKLDAGYTVSIKGDIPINAGLSSSSAVVVAWIRFLMKAFGADTQQSSEYIARLAYEAEVLEYNSPGGLMDQYSISLGNIVFLNTIDGSHSYIDKKLETLVIGESGVPKKTLGVLGDLRSRAQLAIGQVQDRFDSFELESTDVADYQAYESSIDPTLRPYFYAALKNYSITQQAKVAFSMPDLELLRIGSLMYEHHKVLRDILKITVPRIDSMIDAAMSQGAFGAKIVGSGGGGCMVALTDSTNADQIIEVIKKAGASSSYKINIASGATAYNTVK